MMMRSRNDRLGSDPKLPLVWWIIAFWVAVLCFGIVGASRCDAAGTAPLTIYWTNPTTDGGGCDTLQHPPLLDPATVCVQASKNFSAWFVPPGGLKPLVPGVRRSHTLNLTGGLWKVRVVAYDDASNAAISCHEIWAVMMMGRVWAKWINKV
jgi:hypothetical protein